MKIKLMAIASLAVLVGGCKAPQAMLVEPPNVPVYISSYKAKEVNKHASSLKCRLNLINCVMDAAVGEKTVSGKTMSEQQFPVRPIVQAEFENVVKENFSPVKGSEQPNIELKVETQKVLLTIDGKKYRFDYSAAVKVLNPAHEDKPYFSKIYSARTNGKCIDREYVPDCVYKGIQMTLSQFLADLNKDESLLTALGNLNK